MMKLCGPQFDLFFETCYSLLRIISVLKVNILLFYSPHFDLKETCYMNK